MQKLLEDLGLFINSLNINDIIFFSAIIALIILIIIVIYLFRAEDNNKVENEIESVVSSVEFDESKNLDDLVIEEEIAEQADKKAKIVQLSNDDLLGLSGDGSDDSDILPPASDEPDELVDLEMLTKILKDQKYQADVTIDEYEKAQEERAIISYDELIENTKSLKINYLEETEEAGVKIKKVDLDNLTSETDEIEDKIVVELYNYEKEEEFLRTLKDLKKMLS